MQNYRFRAVDSQGRTQQGEAQASSEEGLLAELRSRGLTVLDLREDKGNGSSSRGAKQRKRSFDLEMGVSRKTLTLFTRQLATTLSAGLPLMRILSLIHKKTRNRGLHRILEQMGSDLQHGTSFSEALARHKQVFDGMYLNMVRVGEASGNLSETIARLAQMLEKETALQRKIKSALSYPIFVLVFTSLMGYVMLAFMMPMFTPMFENSGLDIRTQYPLTWFLMNASHVASNKLDMLIVAVALVVGVFGFRLLLRFPSGRFARDFLLFHSPGFSQMIQQSAAARFCRAFSTLLKSGVPLLQALSLVSDASGNMVVGRSIERVARNIQSGDAISQTLEAVGVFPDLVVQMAAIGEEAGSLPEMLERVAEYYEEELDSTINSLTALIEPAMMVVVGAMVGVFVMGILLPILGISTAYQNQMQR